MNKIIAKPWLSLQCQMIPGVRHAVFAADAAEDGAFSTLETWPEGADAPAHVLTTLREAMASEEVEVREPAAEAAESEPSYWVIACALRRAGAVYGGVAVEVGGLETAQVPVVTQLMKWGSAWPAFLAEQEQARREARVDPALRVAAAALEGEDFRAASVAAASALANAYQASRAAIGIRDRRGIRVNALSARAVFDRRSERVRRIEAAMNEACDQEAAIAWPSGHDAPALVTDAHERLSAASEDACVCSIPLRAQGAVSGALTLVRARGRPFDVAEIDQIEALVPLLGPALVARQRADRGAAARLWESGSRLAARALGPGHLRLKTAGAAAAALLAFLTLAKGTHEVAADAVIEGSVERDLVAPIDGFIASADVRAVALVHSGDVLASLDDRALDLERRRLESERDELTNEYHRALGALDRGATRVLQAQIAQAEARLELIRGELERTRVRAPFDAVVVSGDLSQSLGSPVARGDVLFRLAPLDDYRVILEVDEGDVPAVREASGGRLVLAALPGETFELAVERMNGMARSTDERNVLEVEAMLSRHSEHLRPGMRGVARLDSGRARLVWIWTHRLIERLRLWIWAWSPVA